MTQEGIELGFVILSGYFFISLQSFFFVTGVCGRFKSLRQELEALEATARVPAILMGLSQKRGYARLFAPCSFESQREHDDCDYD